MLFDLKTDDLDTDANWWSKLNCCCKIKPKESSLRTAVVGEAGAERHFADLLLEQILLVEEEDDGGAGEELVVADAVEQVEAFMHAVLYSREREEP